MLIDPGMLVIVFLSAIITVGVVALLYKEKVDGEAQQRLNREKSYDPSNTQGGDKMRHKPEYTTSIRSRNRTSDEFYEMEEEDDFADELIAGRFLAGALMLNEAMNQIDDEDREFVQETMSRVDESNNTHESVEAVRRSYENTYSNNDDLFSSNDSGFSSGD